MNSILVLEFPRSLAFWSGRQPSCFVRNEKLSEETGFRNSSLQGLAAEHLMPTSSLARETE
jgi:alpha-amylase/alpha-mannosidase (GH57 family)